MPSGPATDESPLYSTLQADPGFAELLAAFAEEMPRRAAALENALARQAFEEVRRIAHQLKGAASSYGFLPITQLAGQLEHAIVRNEPADKIEDLAIRLAAMCRQVRAG